MKYIDAETMAQKSIISFLKPLNKNVSEPQKRQLPSESQSNKKLKYTSEEEIENSANCNFSENDNDETLTESQKQIVEKKKVRAQIKLQCKRTPALDESIGEGWFTALKTEFSKPYFQSLSSFVSSERTSRKIYPPANQVYSWSNYCDIKDIKVVILGQDPYHGPGQAHGLCFSVQKGIPPPPSLVNMYKELESDIADFKHPGHGCLIGWAKQGVLLLNACLSVRANCANSHKDKGWEQFTDAVIKAVSDQNDGVVFLLWGSYAQKKASAVDKILYYCKYQLPQMMAPKRKRTLKEEGKAYNEEWKLKYFLVPHKDKMICLLCNTVISCLKKYNANLHYEIHKNNKYYDLEGEERKIALNKLKETREHQQQTFMKVFHNKDNAVEATYKVALLLGRRGKPFSDVEIIKESIIEVVSCLDPEKVSKYKDLPLSRPTITTRQHELACNLKKQLNEIISNDVFYSIALDESTDIGDSAQLLIFIRAITKDFKLYEELLSLSTLKNRTRGIDIFKAFKEKVLETNIDLNNLISVCTDGAPAMKGSQEGFIGLLKKELSNPESLITFHCILHQQNLAAKSETFTDTFKKIIGIVNFIRSNAKRHRQFKDMLHIDDETNFVDLPYHSQIRWLSQGKVLNRIFNLKDQIVNFYSSQNKHCELLDDDFSKDAAFLCDIMTKHNELNTSLQGKTKSIYDMWIKIQIFRKKLVFLKNILGRNDFPQGAEEHFPQLTKVLKESEQEDLCESFTKHISHLEILIKNYNDRFTEFEMHEFSLKLAFQPHLVEVSTAPVDYQMELIEMSEDTIVKNLFDSKKDPLEIWKNAIEYPRLREHARKLLSCFATTYSCESTFSFMNQIKTKLRSQLTDAHLEDQLKLRTSMLDPDIKFLVKDKQYQKSH